jgi:Mg2+-importing ATPase
MIGFMALMVPTVWIIRGALSKDWGSATFYSLSVAVGLVPEMLPAILNTNLARGSRRLAKKGAIVKTLNAVQNLGSMTVLCCDKTGTLTKDKATLESAEDCLGNKSLEVLKLAYTNALHQSGTKNDIDNAILQTRTDSLGEKGLLGECISEVPFDFERRRASTLFARKTSDQATLVCKGAFEEVISLCTKIHIGRKVVDLQEATRGRLLKHVHAYNDDGYRVLAVATRILLKESLDTEVERDVENDMILEGLLKFLDPPRDDAEGAITKLQDLGVEIKILTGDNVRIALKLCRSLQIVSGDVEAQAPLRAVTGPELAQLSASDFHAAIAEASVLAKLTPTQKDAVIRSLKEGGRCVGMVGDGINDCIALSVADVGISVNNAVSVAKDCAAIILTEKRLRTVVSAIRIGRTTRGNTMKYIKMVASSNFGNVLSLLVASAWLPYQPMTPLQVVLQNLLYDLSQMAIPWDTMDAEYLASPHSWAMWDTLRFVMCLGPTSSVIDVTTFLISWFYFGVRTADDTAGIAQAQSHWFLQGLLTQVLIVHVLRTAKVPFVKSSSRAPGPLAFTTLAVAGIGLAIPFIPPLGQALAMGFPAKEFIGLLVAEILGYCLLVQVVKMVYVRLVGRWL